MKIIIDIDSDWSLNDQFRAIAQALESNGLHHVANLIMRLIG